MVTSIRTDEARHAQIGHPVLTLVMKHDPGYAQYLTGTPRSAILCSPW
jgi:toluene monooxygenase system protein A